MADSSAGRARANAHSRGGGPHPRIRARRRLILDSSAIVAITLNEPDAQRLTSHAWVGGSLAVGTPALVEVGIVLHVRLGTLAIETIELFIREFEVAVLPFTSLHWSVALDAWSRFGRGRHPARLNFGDCLTYATARLAGEPLLCTGNDFVRTDLEIA